MCFFQADSDVVISYVVNNVINRAFASNPHMNANPGDFLQERTTQARYSVHDCQMDSKESERSIEEELELQI